MAIKENTERQPPDIFRAATENNVSELRDALAEGQSLDSRHAEFYLMTPMHLACVKKSRDFLQVALQHEFNAWSQDSNGRLSMDHAIVNGLEDIADQMLEKLYPTGPDGKPVMPF
jgi:ankyrin repeat protein